MCWIGKGPAFLAERDITVYKVGCFADEVRFFLIL